VPFLNTRAENSIRSFVKLINELREQLAGNGHSAGEDSVPDLGEIVEAVIEKSGYGDKLKGSNDPQDQSRLDNIHELVSVAHEFSADAASLRALADSLHANTEDEDTELDTQTAEEGTEGLAEPGSLAAFLERVSLVADTDQIPDEGEGVITLMTLHSAKGLEFPVVFVTGWEDGQFPHMRSLGDPEELAEERRLAYVGITRAQQKLYLSRTVVRSSWGQPQSQPQSRFLDEIPDELIDVLREEPYLRVRMTMTSIHMDRPVVLGTTNLGVVPARATAVVVAEMGDVQKRWGSASSAFSNKSPRTSGSSMKKPALVLDPGDRVVHDKYGLGKVLEVSGSGIKATATIDFGSAGVVRLMLIGSVPMEKL